MPNEAYRRRQEEWEKKERERREAARETPYDPRNLEVRVPLGCTLIVIMAAIAIAYLIYRYFKYHA